MRPPDLASVATTLALLGATARAQTPTPALPPLMSDSAEIALALSAAPPAVSARAAVYVLRRGGHVKVREGTNGYTCVVNRDHPLSLYPECYDAEASNTMLPAELLAQRWREQGVPEAEVHRRVEGAFKDGRLSRPRRVAIAYMMSPRQRLYASAAGPFVGAWHPHMMIYVPQDATPTPSTIPAAMHDIVSVREEWTVTELTVLIHQWSDGTAEQRAARPAGAPAAARSGSD